MGLFSIFSGRSKHSETQADTRSAKSEPDLYDYWLCGDWFPVKRRGVYYFYQHKYVNYRKGDLLTLPKKPQGYPLYKVEGWTKDAWGDNAGFDDGRKYKLKFVRYVKSPKLPTKAIMERR